LADVNCVQASSANGRH